MAVGVVFASVVIALATTTVPSSTGTEFSAQTKTPFAVIFSVADLNYPVSAFTS